MDLETTAKILLAIIGLLSTGLVIKFFISKSKQVSRIKQGGIGRNINNSAIVDQTSTNKNDERRNEQ